MQSPYEVGQVVRWWLGEAVIEGIEEENGAGGEKLTYYHVRERNFHLCSRATREMLDAANGADPSVPLFHARVPHVVVVDQFYVDAPAIRELALAQRFRANSRAYKGKRTTERFLFPGAREAFERLLGVGIRNWLHYETNGVFQITRDTDPLVWHSDRQSYAAAIYLTPDVPPGTGTSFWRDTRYGCRRAPFHALESDRWRTDAERHAAQDNIYSGYNLVHPDHWELVDKVGAVFNRLVIWDAQLIHSASSYEWFTGEEGDEAASSRLVQLFFFDVRG